MSLFVQCEHCGKGYKLNDRMQGQRVRCQNCGHGFDVRLPVDDGSRHLPLIAPLPPAPRVDPQPVERRPAASRSSSRGDTGAERPAAPRPSRQERAAPRADSPTRDGLTMRQATLLAAGSGSMMLVAIVVAAWFFWSGRDKTTEQTAAAPPVGPTAPSPYVAAPAANALPAPSAATVAGTPLPSGPVVAAPTGDVITGPIAPMTSTAATGLRYTWRPDQDFMYTLVALIESNGQRKTLTAGTIYHVNGASAGPSKTAAAPQTGTGTGFFVSNDGYLVTCAHVVQGATKIEVTLGAQTWQGEVVALDKAHDLAVVRVPAQSVPILPLGVASAVELAQEVRAVGFPLSDVLGTSIKVTRGTVAGIVQMKDKKLFQVDCSINPGNSGGPVVDESGAVVGVASAKLAGEEISNVGFAVPVDEVIRLLAGRGIKYRPASTPSPLSGPELARRVTPAVPLLKVTIGPGGVGAAAIVDLSFSGFYDMDGTSRGQKVGSLQVDEYGDVLDESNDVPLPMLLGTLGQVMLNPLSADGQAAWETQRLLTLTQTEVEQPDPNAILNDLLGRRRRGRFGSPFSPFGQPESTRVTVTPAVERVSYELGSAAGTFTPIKKHYELRRLTSEKTAGDAIFTSDGTISFDTSLGLPKEIKYSVTMTPDLSAPLQQVTAEVTVFRQEAPGGLPSGEAPNGGAPSGVVAPPGEMPREASMVVSDADLTRWIKELSSDDINLRRTAILGLNEAIPAPARRAEVALALCGRLLDGDRSVSVIASSVLKRWVGPECLSGLIAAVEASNDETVLSNATRCLGRIPDRRSSRALAGVAEAHSATNLRSVAFSALNEIGRLAEPDVIPLLGNPTREVRLGACLFLKQHGGSAGRAALQKRFHNEPDDAVKLNMKGAIDAIK